MMSLSRVLGIIDVITLEAWKLDVLSFRQHGKQYLLLGRWEAFYE